MFYFAKIKRFLSKINGLGFIIFLAVFFFAFAWIVFQMKEVSWQKS
ncbi:MAG: hypothetical protein Q8R18_02610 [bacterium]|nr:hypothetical protein [bacterium]